MTCVDDVQEKDSLWFSWWWCSWQLPIGCILLQLLLPLHPVINCLTFDGPCLTVQVRMCELVCTTSSQAVDEANLGAHRHKLRVSQLRHPLQAQWYCTWHITHHSFEIRQLKQPKNFYSLLYCLLIKGNSKQCSAHTIRCVSVCLSVCLISTGHFATQLGGQWMGHRQLLCQWNVPKHCPRPLSMLSGDRSIFNFVQIVALIFSGGQSISRPFSW